MLFVGRRKCPSLHSISVILLHDNAWLYTVHNTDWELVAEVSLGNEPSPIQSGLDNKRFSSISCLDGSSVRTLFHLWWRHQMCYQHVADATGIYVLYIQDGQTYHTLANLILIIPHIIRTINCTGLVLLCIWDPLRMGPQCWNM
jgi:hypothetical protein